MDESSRLSWSAFTLYEGCPQRFLWRFGWGDIDLGYGPGRGKPRKKSSRHNAVMGIVVQSAIEKMYNDELYRDPGTLSEVLSDYVLRAWGRETRNPRNFIDYTESRQSSSEMIEVCQDGVLGYLKTMKANKLLGPYSRAEVELVGWVNKYLCVWGIADLVIRRDDTGITLLDGKNSVRKNADPDQLRWYAMLFKLAYKKLPDRLGFVYYRFPNGTPYNDPETGELREEEGVDWVEFDEGDIQGLALRAQEARNGMRREKFKPKPSPAGCKYCDFLSECEARQDQIVANGGGSSRKPSKNLQVDDIVASDGFSDFGM